MTQRALTFGSAAAAYEQFRPGYPDVLVDAVLARAERPVATALEIGAGTGKATRAFALRDIAVTATDPDAEMLAELARRVPGVAAVVQASLEEIVPGSGATSRPFDLVYVGAALHWTDPATRCRRIADLLTEDGVFASFGGPSRLADPQVRAAVAAARAPWLADDRAPMQVDPSPESGLDWPGTELVASGLFRDVVKIEIPRRFPATPEEYVGYLSTVSAYLQLPPHVRTKALDAVRAVLPDPVEVNADIVLHVARRA